MVARREMLLAVTGPVAAAGGGLALLKLLAVILGPADLGLLVLLLSLTGILQGCLVAGHSNAAMRFASLACQAGAGRRLAAAILAMAARRGAWILPLGAALLAVSVLTGLLSPLAAIGVVGLGVIQAASGIADGWIMSFRRQGTYALTVVLGTVLRLVGVYAGTLLTDRPAGAILGMAAAQLLILLVQGLLIRADLRCAAAPQPITRDWHGEVVAFAKPFLGWSLLGSLQSAAERWSLPLFVPLSDVGKFGAAAQLSSAPANLASSMISNYAFPRLVSRWDGERPGHAEMRRWLHGALLAVTALVLLSALAAVAAPLLVPVLLSPRFHGVELILPVMILSYGLLALGQCLSNPLMVLDPQLINRPKIAVPVVGAAGAFLLAAPCGLWGAVLAGLGASMLYLGWMVIILSRLSRRPNGHGTGKEAA
jgi:O-antigen/teichoic acid export membrane protein